MDQAGPFQKEAAEQLPREPDSARSEAANIKLAGIGDCPVPAKTPRRHALIAGALFLAAFSLYLLTLAPSVATLFDDSLEFQLVTVRLGIAHPTGYPLYTLLGYLFTWLPVGNVAYRVNLMSAVFGAATVAALYPFILRLTRPSRGWPAHAGAVMGALLFAVGPVFWQQATIAEVYTLHAFLMVLILLAAVTARTVNDVTWVAMLFGLGLAHHRTTVLLAPAVGLFLLLQFRGALFSRGLLARAALGAFLPLLLYLYLPLRGHVGSLDGAYLNTWAGFWQQVTASGYGTFIFSNPFGHNRDAAFYLALLTDQFYTLVPGLIGLAFLIWPGRPRYLLLTGLAGITTLIFNLFYNVTDIEVFFIPLFLLWAVWSGLAAAFLLRAATRLTRRGWSAALAALWLAVFGFMIAQVGLNSWHSARGWYSWAVHDYGVDMLRQPLPPGSAVVGLGGEMTLLRYFQQTEAMRPDVLTVAADREPERLAAVENLLAQGKTVYLTRELPQAPERWSLAAVGPLIRVNPTPVIALPAEAIPANLPATPEITLAGYKIDRAPHTGPGPAPVRLALYWRVTAPVAAPLKISARLLGSNGKIVSKVDVAPVHFAYPTPAWRPGEVVADGVDLTIPVDFAAGPVTPLLIWYDEARGAAEVGRVELPPLMER
jgi:hypothetical protein